MLVAVAPVPAQMPFVRLLTHGGGGDEVERQVEAVAHEAVVHRGVEGSDDERCDACVVQSPHKLADVPLQGERRQTKKGVD